MPQTQLSAFKMLEDLGINKYANGWTEEEEDECASTLFCWEINNVYCQFQERDT